MSACQRKLTYRQPQKKKRTSCWIFENVPNEKCSCLTEKKTKNRKQVFCLHEPKNRRSKKGKEKNSNSEEKRKETGNNKNQWLHS